MRDPLEFDSEKIFKLEALLGNCQAIIKDLEQSVAATDLKWQGAEKALQLCEQRLAEAEKRFTEEESERIGAVNLAIKRGIQLKEATGLLEESLPIMQRYYLRNKWHESVKRLVEQ